MITIEFEPADVANVRFAISPLIELWQSVRALQNPATKALHLSWISDTRQRVPDLSMLCALQPPLGCSPDFIHPPPATPLGDFEDELALMLSTPPDQVRLEVSQAHHPDSVPTALRLFIEQPDAAVAELSALLRSYWQLALAPHWERIRAVLQGDVLYRARQNADRGAQTLFADIDPTVRFTGHRLLIDKPWNRSVALNGRGLLFIPSAFVWPALAVIDDEPWQPTMIYPARGSALLWEPVHAAPEALGALIGARRAAVLMSLDAPRSTTDLARRLGLRPGSVSQHLAVLRDAGLISRHRVGRLVLYGRSSRGESLANEGLDARKRMDWTKERVRAGRPVQH